MHLVNGAIVWSKLTKSHTIYSLAQAESQAGTPELIHIRPGRVESCP